jgi:hypothetical protein
MSDTIMSTEQLHDDGTSTVEDMNVNSDSLQPEEILQESADIYHRATTHTSGALPPVLASSAEIADSNEAENRDESVALSTERTDSSDAEKRGECVAHTSLPDTRGVNNDVVISNDKRLFKNDLFRKITRKRRGRPRRMSSKLLSQDDEEDGIFNDDDDGIVVDEAVGPGIALSVTAQSDAYVTDDGDSTVDTWSIEDEYSGETHLKPYDPQHRRPNQDFGVRMSAADIAICQQLDAEYDRALEERDVTFTARYQSVRQSACLSIVFMALFVLLGTLFFERQAPDWSIGTFISCIY